MFGARAGRDRLRRVRRERLFALRFARPQHVEADARDDRGQPAAQVVDAGGIRAAEPQPRFLHGIVHLGRRAEHPVGHGAQVGAVLFESLGQIITLAHRSHSPVVFRHSGDAAVAANVTSGEKT